MMMVTNNIRSDVHVHTNELVYFVRYSVTLSFYGGLVIYRNYTVFIIIEHCHIKVSNHLKSTFGR